MRIKIVFCTGSPTIIFQLSELVITSWNPRLTHVSSHCQRVYRTILRMQDYSTLQCNLCGNTDYSNFEYSFTDDSCICRNCGAVLHSSFDFGDFVRCWQNNEETHVLAEGTVNAICNSRDGEFIDLDGKENEASPKAKRRRTSYKGSYNRRAYFNERFSEDAIKQPEIPPEHKDVIRQEYQEFLRTGCYTGAQPIFAQMRHQMGYLTKPDIQAILHSIDYKNTWKDWVEKVLQMDPDWEWRVQQVEKQLSVKERVKYFLPLVVGREAQIDALEFLAVCAESLGAKECKRKICNPLYKKNNYFSSHYLEKSKDIRSFLLQKELPILSEVEKCTIGSLLMRMSNLWNIWQPPSRKDEKHKCFKFPDRTDFPSLNFMIRKCMEVLNIKGHFDDFPMPKTRSSLKKLNAFWEEMLPYLNLPNTKAVITPKLKQPTITTFLGKRCR
jgi:hypothetical protein